MGMPFLGMTPVTLSRIRVKEAEDETMDRAAYDPAKSLKLDGTQKWRYSRRTVKKRSL